MKQTGTLLEHDGHECFLLEDGYNDDTRAVVFLVRAGDPRFPTEGTVRPVALKAHPGEWLAIARWTRDGLHIPEPEHETHRALIGETIGDYVRSVGRPEPVAWAVTEGEAFAGSLEQAVPMGVAVHCHDDEDAARDRAHGRALVPIDDLSRFLNHMVRLGYAGAMWNSVHPVFFCVDEGGDLHYLRVAPGDDGHVVMEILDDHDRWETYEGAEKVGFLDNADACDERLVEEVGRRPLLDWPPDGRLHSIGAGPSRPALLEDEEATAPRYGVLFTDADEADEFRRDHDPTWVTFEVDDTSGFLQQSGLRGCVARLNPGGHRAHGGVLWDNGEVTVLESFSGFWRLKGGVFEPFDEG